MTFLIDSDRVLDFLSASADANRLWSTVEQTGVSISIVTFGEILEGVLFGRDPETAERDFGRWVRSVVVLPVDEPVARRFAQLRGDLRRRGLLIQDLDLLIAATALHHDLTLVTRNRRHFERVPGIRLYPDPA